MKTKPKYYTTLHANVRYDNKLPDGAKILYSEIYTLCIKSGKCWASNGYFSELYEKDKSTISKYISNLKKSGYIKIQYTYHIGKKEVKERIITLVKPNNLGSHNEESLSDHPVDLNQVGSDKMQNGIDMMQNGIDVMPKRIINNNNKEEYSHFQIETSWKDEVLGQSLEVDIESPWFKKFKYPMNKERAIELIDWFVSIKNGSSQINSKFSDANITDATMLAKLLPKKGLNGWILEQLFWIEKYSIEVIAMNK